MEGKEEIITNGFKENNNNVDEDTSEERTVSDNKSSLVSDEQEIEVDETVQPTTSTGRLSSSQRRRMRKKKTPAENSEKWRQFYNLRRGRPVHVTPSEVLAEVAADKNIDQRLKGWKLTLVGNQMDAISDIETRNIEVLSGMLVRNTCPVDDSDSDTEDSDDSDESDRPMTAAGHRRQYQEMIEQSKLVREKMQLARLQMMRVFRHKAHVTSIVEKAILEDRLQREDAERK